MKRGSIWTVAGGGNYTGKPRPVVVVQDERFQDLNSITVCPMTSDVMETGLVRPMIQPGPLNGLRVASQVMVDKITTVPKDRLGNAIGVLGDTEMVQIERALVVFLGIGA